MQRSIKILWVLFLVAAAGMSLTWWIARSRPATVQYQYATFRWPAGTESALYNFEPGDPSTNDGDVTCSFARLSEILERAREATGFDYFSSAGDTVILRRVALTDASNPLTERTNLRVVANPPESQLEALDRLRAIGHVKPVK